MPSMMRRTIAHIRAKMSRSKAFAGCIRGTTVCDPHTKKANHEETSDSQESQIRQSMKVVQIPVKPAKNFENDNVEDSDAPTTIAGSKVTSIADENQSKETVELVSITQQVQPIQEQGLEKVSEKSITAEEVDVIVENFNNDSVNEESCDVLESDDIEVVARRASRKLIQDLLWKIEADNQEAQSINSPVEILKSMSDENLNAENSKLNDSDLKLYVTAQSEELQNVTELKLNPCSSGSELPDNNIQIQCNNYSVSDGTPEDNNETNIESIAEDDSLHENSVFQNVDPLPMFHLANLNKPMGLPVLKANMPEKVHLHLLAGTAFSSVPTIEQNFACPEQNLNGRNSTSSIHSQQVGHIHNMPQYGLRDAKLPELDLGDKFIPKLPNTPGDETPRRLRTVNLPNWSCSPRISVPSNPWNMPEFLNQNVNVADLEVKGVGLFGQGQMMNGADVLKVEICGAASDVNSDCDDLHDGSIQEIVLQEEVQELVDDHNDVNDENVNDDNVETRKDLEIPVQEAEVPVTEEEVIENDDEKFEDSISEQDEQDDNVEAVDNEEVKNLDTEVKDLNVNESEEGEISISNSNDEEQGEVSAEIEEIGEQIDSLQRSLDAYTADELSEKSDY